MKLQYEMNNCESSSVQCSEQVGNEPTGTSMGFFSQWEKISKDSFEVKPTCVDITKDLIAGIILSRIISLCRYPENHKDKTANRNGQIWVAIARNGWWTDCRVSAEQFDRAVKILIKKKMIKTAVYRFKSGPRKHLLPNWNVIEQRVTKAVKNNLHREG